MISEETLRDHFPISSWIGPVWLDEDAEEWKVDSLIVAHGRVFSHDGRPMFSAHLCSRAHLFFDGALADDTLQGLLGMVLRDEALLALTDAWSRVSQCVSERQEGASAGDFEWPSAMHWACTLLDADNEAMARLECDEDLDMYTLDFGDVRMKYATLGSAMDGLVLRRTAVDIAACWRRGPRSSQRKRGRRIHKREPCAGASCPPRRASIPPTPPPWSASPPSTRRIG